MSSKIYLENVELEEQARAAAGRRRRLQMFDCGCRMHSDRPETASQAQEGLEITFNDAGTRDGACAVPYDRCHPRCPQLPAGATIRGLTAGLAGVPSSRSPRYLPHRACAPYLTPQPRLYTLQTRLDPTYPRNFPDTPTATALCTLPPIYRHPQHTPWPAQAGLAAAPSCCC